MDCKVLQIYLQDCELEVLSFMDTKLGTLASTKLCAALERHETIRTLNLAGCALSDVAAKAVAAVIKANKSITHLDLSWNNIGGTSCMQ